MSGRRSTQTIAVAVGLLGALAACQTDGTSTAGGTPTPGATASASITASATPTGAATGSPTATEPVLGPDGFGTLKLGMTRAQAEATGVADPFKSRPEGGTCRWYSHLRGASGDNGTVIISETLGVAAIVGYPGVRTPEGISIGSSLAEIGKAFPAWKMNADLGRGYATAPGNPKAVYRIEINDGRADSLTLQLVNQNCYE
jgi:hypothetical protein